MTDTNIGRRLGNYVIETFLAAGGMSRVYQGRHTMLGRRAAIKVLKPELLFQESLLWRFKNEAVAMEKLADSLDIINVYDFYEEGNFLAIIMELLEGETLKARIQHKAMNDVEIKQIFPRVLDAFGFAHKKGIIHRDVKPSNIFLLNDGGLRILDFGIAKIGDSENKSDYTATGTQMGTVIYMSPEQVLDAKHLDLRSDIYSIGVSLYHCITGKAPYDIESLSRFEIQRRIVYEPIEGIQTLAEPFRSIIEKCTAKKPEDRFQTCDEIKKTLLGTTKLFSGDLGILTPEINTEPSAEIVTDAETEILSNLEQKFFDKEQPIINDNGITLPIIEMIFINGGTFTMGSPECEVDRVYDEVQHQVTVSDFYMGKYPITFEQYDAFCKAVNRNMPDDEGWGRGKHPVVNVSWEDAVEYCE